MCPVQGSHDIIESDDKVVIRRLELFSGYDPSIDDGSDEEIKKFDRRRVARIVDRTRQFISRKQHPRLVILHSQEDHSEPKEAVGAVLDVQLEERNGVPFVIGDVEMSRDDFAAYVASNRFPRRSAEIWQDDHMSEIALLGRDTPRRPLPDTRFSKQGDKIVFAMECSSCFEAAPGVGNVFVPGAGVKKECNMADEAKVEKKDEKDEMSKMIAEKDAEIARLKEENRKMYNQTHVDIDSHEGDEDEDEDEEEDEKEKAKKSKHSKSGDKTEFARMKEKFERRIAALETDLAKERFSRELDSMAADGFAVDCCRDEMIEELVSSSNPQRKIAFWRENFRRDPVGVRVAATPRSGAKPDMSSTLDRDTVAKLVAEAAGDADKFKTLMARAKSGA
jgi:uncharacterized coiled-coil protein SlyX